MLWPESGVPDYLEDGYPTRYYLQMTAGGDPKLARARIGRVIGPQSTLLTGVVNLNIGTNASGVPAAVSARNSVMALDGKGALPKGAHSQLVRGTPPAAHKRARVGGVLDLGVRVLNTGGALVIGGANSNEGNLISGNVQSGIRAVGATDLIIQGNRIGTDRSGTIDLGNGGNGVQLLAGSNDAQVGGAAAGEGNLIAGNTTDGIAINLSSGATIQGNIIGLNAGGTAALGNASDGIQVDATTGTIIGGATPAQRNIISGNTSSGIRLFNADGNTITNNYIGTDITGALDLGNGTRGIELANDSDTNIIGTNGDGINDVAEGNVISGNNGFGINIRNAPANDNNIIAGNIIGLNAAGNATVGNGIGMQLEADAAGTVVGGALAAQRNIISGNTLTGITMAGAPTARIIGHYIPTAKNALVKGLYERLGFRKIDEINGTTVWELRPDDPADYSNHIRRVEPTA